MRQPSGRGSATPSVRAFARLSAIVLLMFAAGAVFVAPALAAGSVGGLIYNDFVAPIENAKVDVWRSPDNVSEYVWLGMGLSNSTGAYSVPTPGAGWYKVQFSDPLGRYVSEWWGDRAGGIDQANPIWLGEDQNGTFVNAVLAPAGRVGGVVIAVAGGAQLENIRVDVFRWSDEQQDWVGTAECYTDVNGSWSAAGLRPGQYRFHFRDEAGGVYADQFWDRQTFWDSAHSFGVYGGMDVDNINAQLEVGAFVGGVVRDEGGLPIAGAQVTAFGQDNWGNWPGVRSATTNAFGQYTLGPLASGDYRVWFNGAATWVSEYWNDKRYDGEADAVSLVSGQNFPCDATLTRAGTISGHVVADGPGGAPLEGMAIDLYRWNGWDWWQVQGGWWFTDADGFYSIGGLDPGNYRVQFTDPNGQWATEYFDNVPGWTGPTEVIVSGGLTTTVDASLAPAGHIAGTVRDPDGNPLQGIDISCCLLLDRENGQWDWVGGAQTDGTGYFDIGGLPAGVHQLELSDPTGTYAVEVYENALNFGEGIDLEVVAGGTTSADPVLDRGGRIYGQVVDPDGNGIANVMVTFNGWRENLDTPDDPTDGWWEWYTECYTDENGDFSMSGLQARPTVIQFGDESGRFVEEWYDDARNDGAATPVDVQGGRSRNIGQIELAAAGHVVGTVTADGGGPLENIEVTVARWRADWGDWDHFAGGQTDADGHYDVGGLAAGSYRVWFRDPSAAYSNEWFENAPDASSGQDVAVTQGGTTQVDAALEEACVIEGHVTDRSANPLSGIETILYYREAGGEWAQYQLDNEERMITGPDGYYRFAGLPPQKYQLRLENQENPDPWAAEVFDDALVVGTGTDLDFSPGETRTVDPELDLGGRLAGRLLDDESFIPLSFAFPMEIGVWTWIPDAGPDGGSWQRYAGYSTGDGTDGYMHGSDLAPGEYRLDFSCWTGSYVYEAWQDQPDLEHATPVAIVAGETTDLGTILMQRSAMIFGHVTGPGGEPLAGVTVRKWTLVDGQWDPGYSFESWSDGFYQLGEMAGGTYRVEFDGRGIGYSREFWDGASSVLGATDIVLAPRQEVSGIDARLEVPGAIAGHVRDAGGGPITGVDVMLAVWDDIAGRYVDLDDMQSVARVDDQGAWRLDGLRPGTYKVFSSPGAPDHGDGVVEGVVVRAGETTEVDIVPPLAGSIAGRVTAIGGSPVQDARVRLFIWDPYKLEWQGLAMPAQTQSDGTYSMPLVTPGTYRLAFEPPEASDLAQEFWDNRDTVDIAHDITVAENEDLTGIDTVLGPAADAAPPSDPTADGADTGWHAAPVRLDFSATDDLSGVAEYEYTVDDGPWRHGDHVVVGAPADHANDGVHDVEARAIDNVGHLSGTTAVQVKIDTTGPVVSDDDSGAWSRGPVTVHLSAVDAGCGVVDHIEYAPRAGGPWQAGASFVVSTGRKGSGSGERTTWVRGIDALGNASDPAPVAVLLDGRPPITTSDSDGLPHDTTVTVHLTATDAHSGLGWTYFSVDGGAWMIGDTVVVPALAGGLNDGLHTLWFYSVDAAGNVEPRMRSCVVVIDMPGVP